MYLRYLFRHEKVTPFSVQFCLQGVVIRQRMSWAFKLLGLIVTVR